MMRPIDSRRSLSAGCLIVCVIAATTVNGQMAALTAQDKAQGWKLLFDGKSLAGWRGYKTEMPPQGWRADNGVLTLHESGGDLMTVEQFDDFELRLEWKISANGNSGIIYRISPDGPYTYSSGPEYQVLDNAGHKDGKTPLTSAASNFAVNAPIKDVTKPVGEWNDVRLIVHGDHVEHWLNGVKVVEYELGSDDWEARVKASKFATMPWYGRARRGYIALQDHGDRVSYRNIRIRRLR